MLIRSGDTTNANEEVPYVAKIASIWQEQPGGWDRVGWGGFKVHMGLVQSKSIASVDVNAVMDI